MMLETIKKFFTIMKNEHTIEEVKFEFYLVLKKNKEVDDALAIFFDFSNLLDVIYYNDNVEDAVAVFNDFFSGETEKIVYNFLEEIYCE